MRHSKVLNAEMIFVSLVFLFFNHASTLSIGSTSDVQNLTKREAIDDFYPDWVPFKNKNGDELGEFVTVTKKTPRKRLALPANFILRAQSDQDNEDFFDKGTDDMGDDYYEKKEWSSLTKSESIDSDPTKISDINGIVNIITNSNEKVEPVKEEETSNDENEGHNKEEPGKSQDTEDGGESDAKDSKEINKDENEYDDKVLAKQTTEKEFEEQRENEAKKAKILGSVDELKERHAKEQRAISEQVKEEEMFKEEREKDRYRDSREFDKYNNKIPVKWRREKTDYDEYDDKVFDVSNKYKIIGTKSRKKQPEKKNPKPESNPLPTIPEKPIIHEKISVFTNPQAYVISDYEDSEEITTQSPMKPKASRNKETKKFSSRYLEPNSKKQKSERISLEPEEDDFKEGEPTLFFPKKRTGKNRLKNKNSKPVQSSESDSIEAETVLELEHKEPSYRTPKTVTEYVTLYDTEPTEKAKEEKASNEDTSGENKPTALDTVPSAADSVINTAVAFEDDTLVTDPLPSSTDHKEEKEPGSFEYEKGRGGQHEASSEEEQEEHGKKAYEGKHEETKTSKGHHDKEDHMGKYNDHGGVDKHHHDESGHYGHHHHEEHGKKHAKYEESGKHSKGHSTKGSHDIHKKEEYEKNVEFFEEDGDFSEEMNHGGHHDEKSHAKGGHFKHGKLRAGHEGGHKDTKGHYSKGGSGHFNKGHKSAKGHDHHGRHGNTNFHREGNEAGKKWIYHHGYPPRAAANLAAIDRRDDLYVNGDRFYG